MIQSTWASFLRTARPSLDADLVGHVLCLDPGETTGWALFEKGLLRECGQWQTSQPAILADEISNLNARHFAHGKANLDLIVYEEYRVRGNKFKEHVGSEVVTIQHIGAIKVVASELDIPLVKQTAGMAKGFAIDSKLRRWGLYQTGQRHANDAIRHGCYYLLFAAGRTLPRATWSVPNGQEDHHTNQE
jgi:hypothetical protein